MLKFTHKVMVRESVVAKCERHPRYNPEKDGRAGIKGGCSTCYSLYDLLEARKQMDTAVREFVRRAGPWARARGTRKRRVSADTTPQVAEQPEVQR